jgi:hypothetical protein
MQFVLHVRHLVGKRTSPGFHLCIGCTVDTQIFLPSLDTNLTVLLSTFVLKHIEQHVESTKNAFQYKTCTLVHVVLVLGY